jgi:hypothetical protein
MKSARVPVVLVGNKADMDDQREVTKDEGSTFASQTYAFFFLSSFRSNRSPIQRHFVFRNVGQDGAECAGLVSSAGASGDAGAKHGDPRDGREGEEGLRVAVRRTRRDCTKLD